MQKDGKTDNYNEADNNNDSNEIDHGWYPQSLKADAEYTLGIILTATPIKKILDSKAA